jgi:uncharacterized protein YbaR (Trm112 family)
LKPETLESLRCPYCGGRLELVRADPHAWDGESLVAGILGCDCCTFPVVAGIPVMHLREEAVAARAAVETGDLDRAFRELIAPGDSARAARFEATARASSSTYRELVEVLGPDFEGTYFLYRFTDPTYLVASAVVDSVARVALERGGRAIDLCGGSGHLTRRLVDLSTSDPVIAADLWFAKLWLAARFVAPGCEPVCCDANAPLPFARGSFAFSMCADAFMFIWTKRQLVSEMLRLIDNDESGAAVITHAHNQCVWSPSHGDALPPEGYRALFETIEPRLFAEAALLDDVVSGGPLDLSRRDSPEALLADPALTLIASRNDAVFRKHPLVEQGTSSGELRLNPLYAIEQRGADVSLRLQFPSADYEDEFGACRRFLVEEVTATSETMAAVASGQRTPEVLELLRGRVVLDLPTRYL